MYGLIPTLLLSTEEGAEGSAGCGAAARPGCLAAPALVILAGELLLIYAMIRIGPAWPGTTSRLGDQVPLLRYGGMRTLTAALPFFYGLILGQFIPGIYLTSGHPHE